MFKVILTCDGVPKETGMQVARDVTEEFTHHPWHRSVTCSWDETHLVLEAENDFDNDGLATLDEFSDAITATTSEGFGPLRIVSVSEIAD